MVAVQVGGRACLDDTGALRSTPTAAMAVILDVPQLHIYKQGISTSTVYDLCIVEHRYAIRTVLAIKN